MNDRVPFLESPLAHIPGDKFPSRSEASLWLLQGQQAECPRLWCHLRQGRDPRKVCRLLPQFTDIAEPQGANCGTAHGQRPQVHHWQECGLCQQGVWPGHLVQQSKHGQGITPVEICRQTAAAVSDPPLHWTRGELFFLTEQSWCHARCVRVIVCGFGCARSIHNWSRGWFRFYL